MAALLEPDGKPDLEKIMLKLEALGIYLVPVGEIESFRPIPNMARNAHGPDFVNNVLSDPDLDFGSDAFSNLRKFVSVFHKGASAPLDVSDATGS